MKHIGIFPGSFNPVHIGHLALANYICEYGNLDEVWMMVSPLNPLKEPDGLSDAGHRMEMLCVALAGDPKLIPSDFELHLPRPTYTIETLRLLREHHPDCRFTLIIGGDNWVDFPKWRAYQSIIEEFSILVYPRPGQHFEEELPANVSVIEAPMLDISSTMLRRSLKEGKALRHFYPPGVYDYIIRHGLYRD